MDFSCSLSFFFSLSLLSTGKERDILQIVVFRWSGLSIVFLAAPVQTATRRGREREREKIDIPLGLRSGMPEMENWLGVIAEQLKSLGCASVSLGPWTSK